MIDLSNFDKFQQAVIKETGDKNIVVSASAGAGKTLVLINRILYLALSAPTDKRIPISRIIAMTFTEAAALEMKVRLEKELKNLYRKEKDAHNKELLKNQIDELINARISTIDSYCLSIVQKYYATISLDPSQISNIITDQRKTEIQMRAFNEVLASWNNNIIMHESIKLLYRYFAVRPEDINKLYNCVETIMNVADNSVNTNLFFNDLSSEKKYSERYKNLEKSFLTLSKSIIQRLINKTEHIKTILLSDNPTEKQLNEIDKTLSLLTDSLNSSSYQELQNKFDTIQSFLPTATRASKNNPIGQPDYKEARSAKSYTKIQEEAFMTLFPEDIFNYFKNDYKDIELSLIKLAKETYEVSKRIKEEEKCMTFSDIEHATYEILTANNNHVAKLINKTFDELLIDEFQDTSELQNSIIELISPNRRIFRVGDVKQSIYRFRRAKPSLMQGMIANKDNKYKVFTLKYNYRSNENIVKFSNLLFPRIMNIEGSHNNYSDNDYVIVNPNNAYQLKEINRSHVHFVLLDEESIANTQEISEEEYEEDTSIKKIESETAKSLKANYISKKIKELIEASKDTREPLQYSDFAILVRTNKTQIPIKKSFDAYGIPYAIDTKEGFFKSDLCQDIIGMLQYFIHNDLISYVTILTSPLFQIDDETLADLRIQYNKDKESLSFLDYLKTKLIDANKCIDHLKEIAINEGPIEFIYELYKTKLLTNNTSKNNVTYYDSLSEIDKANFEYFINFTISQKPTNIYDFYNLLLISEEERSSEAITIQKGDNVTIATTIHASKGLQYKYVFLWSTKTYGHLHTSSINVDSNNWIGFDSIETNNRLVYPSRENLLVKKHEKDEELDEYIRTLYVALTRPVEELFIVDTIDAKLDYKDSLTMDDLLEDIGMSGILSYALKDYEEVDGIPLYDVIYENVSKDLPEAEVLEQVNTFENRKDYSNEFTIIPELQSPSSLAKSSENSKLVSLDYSEAGTTYGSALHKALELLNPYEKWTKEMIDNVLAPEVSNREYATQSILSFYEWDIYQRILEENMEIHKEDEVYYEDKEKRLFGAIDFYAVSDKEVILVDYKTDSEQLEDIGSEYFEQINAYKLILQNMYPNKLIKTYIYSLHLHKALEIK